MTIKEKVKSCTKIWDDIKQLVQESHDKKKNVIDVYMSGVNINEGEEDVFPEYLYNLIFMKTHFEEICMML